MKVQKKRKPKLCKRINQNLKVDDVHNQKHFLILENIVTVKIKLP